ncbi:MAG TPA: TatD family hydrolase [Bacteroidales bacterium]|nr:TatD family hydrolase [Bacteroidales bacterium]HOK75284.1 TatD family hydrolase [Bacteroidales bacterium]HOM39764.1 TatD family hydrolase [Bacteroidales bacterium]HPP91320.1 TatD family hydrolase [Bacteroidales bacterium]HRR15344.1 TatD family hydrolase [Bacteroidales bacterium]
MKLIDTHTHIYLPEFDSDRDNVVERAVCKGVKIMLMPNIDVCSLKPMIEASERYKGICLPMAGLHPTSVKEDFENQLEQIEKQLNSSQIIAVGETGIDLYWDKTFINEQIISFRRQLEWAVEQNLPAVIHSRNAFAEIFNVLEEFRDSRLKGVFHAFSGNIETAQKAISMGFKLGIGGVVTFKNSDLSRIVKEAGLDNIVLETDSPYLAPVPYRGKRNESSYLCIVNSKIAEIFKMAEEKTAEITTLNALNLFNINE